MLTPSPTTDDDIVFPLVVVLDVDIHHPFGFLNVMEESGHLVNACAHI